MTDLLDPGTHIVEVLEMERLELYRGKLGNYWRIRMDLKFSKGRIAPIFLAGFCDMSRVLWDLREHIIGKNIKVRVSHVPHPNDPECIFNRLEYRGLA